jgi:1-acyl-sn-glycerol-3-phosphate acyltransferase
MEAIKGSKEELLVFNKFFLFSIKYFLGPAISIALIMGEALPWKFRRVEFRHYDRLPLWEGKEIIAPNHTSWLDVVLVPYIYFPWWLREITDDVPDLFREAIFAGIRITQWVFDDRVKIKFSNGENVFSKDVPITAADKHNLRNFRWLKGFIFLVNREKYGGTKQEKATALRFAKRVLDRNGRVVMFPEGGMLDSAKEEEKIYDIKSRKPIQRALEPGVGVLVRMTGAKIIPILIVGADKVLPRGKFPFPRFWHKITITIGESLTFPTGTDPEIITCVLAKALIDLRYEKNGGQSR